MKLLQQLIFESMGWKVLTKAEAMATENDGIGYWRAGTLDNTSYEELVAKLGKPAEINRERGEKVTCRWYIKGNNGVLASIYDYKTSRGYTGEYEMDISSLHADPNISRELKKRQKIKPKTEAEKLGVDVVKHWSIGTGFMSGNMSEKAAVELIAEIFGDRAVLSLLDPEFRSLFDPT